MPKQYAAEFKDRALRMLDEAMPDHPSEFAAIKYVAAKLGVSAEALRQRFSQPSSTAPRRNDPVHRHVSE